MKSYGLEPLQCLLTPWFLLTGETRWGVLTVHIFLFSCGANKTVDRGDPCESLARLVARLIAAITLTLVATVAVKAQDAGAFHEVETKYIFGNFTVGSSTGIEGEKAFEPETEANFGKGGGGHYAVSQTTLEYEFTPTQYMQIILGPTVSYYKHPRRSGSRRPQHGGN